MTSPIEPRTASLYHASQAPAVEPTTAAAILGAAIATSLLVGALVPVDLAFVVAEIALGAVAFAGVAVAHPERRLAALGLRGAQLRFFVAAIAIGMTAWYLNATLVDFLIAKLSLPTEHAEQLKGLVERPSLLQALATFALLPALCEEIVFRGVLARALGRWAKLIPAVAISAIAFSVYHLSLIQTLPTFTLGLVLGVIAIRADSIAPTVVAHAINNALVIAMSRDALPGIAAVLGEHPIASALGAGAITAGGIVTAARGPA